MRRLPLLILPAVVVVDCSYYDQSLLSPPTATTSEVGGSAGASASCVPLSWPERPTVTNSGGDLALTFAMRTLRFDTKSDAGAIAVGYDLDGKCTCPEKDSCLEPSWATANHCDGPQGRDNAFGAMLEDFAALGPLFGSPAWNKQLDEGAWGLLLRVLQYNGLENDDQVVFEWYMADSVYTIIAQQDGGKPPPKWDGTDKWPVRDINYQSSPGADGGLVYDPTKPLFRDEKAYVSNSVFVGTLTEGLIQASTTLSIKLTNAFVTAKLDKVDSHWELTNGNIAAFWSVDAIFGQLGTMTVSGQPLCRGNQFYRALKDALCQHVDSNPLRSPTAECNALSIGIGFTAVPAELGEMTHPLIEASKCDPEEDPATDHCGS